jgi:ligand-binding SRPBCC domain-containing protein
MPSFRVQTRVNATMENVWSRFDASLLTKLSPPFPTVRIVRFDGCQTGDQVSLELNLIAVKPIWNSLITSSAQTDTHCVFVDEGTKMPFGLIAWRHEHRIEKIDAGHCQIVDQISFKTKFWFLDYLLFPFLWGMIVYRIPLYKLYLNQPTNL